MLRQIVTFLIMLVLDDKTVRRRSIISIISITPHLKKKGGGGGGDLGGIFRNISSGRINSSLGSPLLIKVKY